MEQIAQFQLSKDYLQKLKKAVDRHHYTFIKESLRDANHADVSEILEEFNAENSKYILNQLDEELSAEVINDLDTDIRIKFLKTFGSEEIARYLDHLDSDDAVDILNELPVKAREEVIPHIENEEKVKNILDLLRYDDDCAGGLMAKELIKANINWTVVQTIEEIRRQAENVQKIYSVYVVDDRDVLLGRVSLKEIILANDTRKIRDIYEEGIESVPTYMPEEEVAALMAKYDLEAVPVLNVQGQLLGRITIDDIVDVITEQAEEERQLMSGISEDVEEDDSIWMLSRARLHWLIIGLAGALRGARLIGVVQGDIHELAGSASLLPLLTVSACGVGIQSSTLVVQSLANPSAFDENLFQKMIKVFLVAILNGMLLAVLVFVFVMIINDGDLQLSLVVSVALFSVVVIASFLGTLIPLILEKAGINPALASGPFITTANDLVGLGIYFTIIHFIYI